MENLLNNNLPSLFTVENIKKHIIYTNNKFEFDNTWFLNALKVEIAVILSKTRINKKQGFNLTQFILDLASIVKNTKKIILNKKYQKIFQTFINDDVNKTINDINSKLVNLTTNDDKEILCDAILSIQKQLLEKLSTLKNEYYNEYSSI